MRVGPGEAQQVLVSLCNLIPAIDLLCQKSKYGNFSLLGVLSGMQKTKNLPQCLRQTQEEWKCRHKYDKRCPQSAVWLLDIFCRSRWKRESSGGFEEQFRVFLVAWWQHLHISKETALKLLKIRQGGKESHHQGQQIMDWTKPVSFWLFWLMFSQTFTFSPHYSNARQCKNPNRACRRWRMPKMSVSNLRPGHSGHRMMNKPLDSLYSSPVGKYQISCPPRTEWKSPDGLQKVTEQEDGATASQIHSDWHFYHYPVSTPHH